MYVSSVMLWPKKCGNPPPKKKKLEFKELEKTNKSQTRMIRGAKFIER
jgi:hypothetical protein